MHHNRSDANLVYVTRTLYFSSLERLNSGTDYASTFQQYAYIVEVQPVGEDGARLVRVAPGNDQSVLPITSPVGKIEYTPNNRAELTFKTKLATTREIMEYVTSIIKSLYPDRRLFTSLGYPLPDACERPDEFS